MKVRELLKGIEQTYPLSYASSWDNPGLQAGDRNKDVNKVFVALDATDQIIEEAVMAGADLLITHHPMIFSPLQKVNTDDFIGRRLVKLMEQGIAYYAMHTNYDVLRMASLSAEILGLTDDQVLEPTYREQLYKIVVFVPEKEAEQVRQAMTETGAGHLGNYSHCTFAVAGTGTFLPGEGTHPYLGRTGQLKRVSEVRLETIVPGELLSKVLHKMIEVHPYEEAAYDVYPLEREGESEGFGRVGKLPEHISTLEECCKLVKERFHLEHVKAFGDLKKPVKRAAISPGSGKSMIPRALSEAADVLITGDITHHEGIDADNQGLAIIDAGHYGLEHIFIKDMEAYIKNNWSCLEVVTEQIKNPIQVI